MNADLIFAPRRKKIESILYTEYLRRLERDRNRYDLKPNSVINERGED